jgi:hypothetical protein
MMPHFVETSDLNTLANQFLLNDPQVYDSSIPDTIGNKFPALKALANNRARNVASPKVLLYTQSFVFNFTLFVCGFDHFFLSFTANK